MRRVSVERRSGYGAEIGGCGAAAIVMHSLFEEQILEDAMRRAPLAGEPGQYLEHLLRVKQRVRIPVIASLNGTTPEGWLQYARALERAGADALELNFYYIATDPADDAQAVEQRVLDIVAVVKESVFIPLAVKLTPFYSSVPHMAARLDRIGAGRAGAVQSVLSGRHRPGDPRDDRPAPTVGFGRSAAASPFGGHLVESRPNVAGHQRRHSRTD